MRHPFVDDPWFLYGVAVTATFVALVLAFLIALNPEVTLQ